MDTKESDTNENYDPNTGEEKPLPGAPLPEDEEDDEGVKPATQEEEEDREDDGTSREEDGSIKPG